MQHCCVQTILLDLCMLERHWGKRTTSRWNALATPLPLSNKTGIKRLFEWVETLRAKTFRCSREIQRFSENNLQGKEGIFRPVSLLMGATGGTSWVCRVSSGGRRQRVCGLSSLLQELIKLWNKQSDLSETGRVESQSYVWCKNKGENSNSLTHICAKRPLCICDITFTGHPFLGRITFLLKKSHKLKHTSGRKHQ